MALCNPWDVITCFRLAYSLLVCGKGLGCVEMAEGGGEGGVLTKVETHLVVALICLNSVTVEVLIVRMPYASCIGVITVVEVSKSMERKAGGRRVLCSDVVLLTWC